MNEGEEIRFIDLFSGIGGFRLGLEKAGESLSVTGKKRQNHHGNEKRQCEQHSAGHSRRATTNSFRIGLERANNRMEKDGVESGISRRSCTQPQTVSPSKEERTGYFRCVWSCDNNKYANQIYTKHFGEEGHYPGDIKGVNPRDIPDFDLLCAGFPCQAFSVAGKRKGFEDTRGTLFFEICRIAEAKRPPLLLLENVRGLLSHDKGLTFQVILESLEELGYWAEWQVLNSKYFGVPQNRQRVFIIGHLRGTGGREIFPIGEADEMAQGEDEGKREQISLAIDKNYWKGPDKHGQRTVIGVTLANTSRYRQGVKRTPLKKDENSFALNSAGDQGVLLDFRIRRLTPIECERLQGFPDGWTEFGYVKGTVVDTEPVYGWRDIETEPDGNIERRWVKIGEKPIEPIKDTIRISDTQRYKCLGNAVTTNVVEFLGRRIKECIKPTPAGVVQLTQIMEVDG